MSYISAKHLYILNYVCNTEGILGNEGFGHAGRTSTKLVLGHHSEDVLLLLDEFGHQVATAAQGGGD